VTHPKAGEWWCPGRWRGRTEEGDTYAGCDGDEACEVCHGQTLDAALTGAVSVESWAVRCLAGWQGKLLRGWANLMASRYGRPVYLVGGALEDRSPRDVDVRVVLSATEWEARFGSWREQRYATHLESMDAERRWHVETAKMNKQGAGATHLPIDFQVQSLPEAMPYTSKRRQRLDDLPGLVPPWED
jgi:hypothetical protein